MEDVEEFYRNKGLKMDRFQPSGIGHFNVFDIEYALNPKAKPINYTRRDFYKISLIRGKHIFHYANHSIEINGSTLMFFNPQIPYSFVQGDSECSGYFLIFKEQFLSDSIHHSPSKVPVFSIDGCPNYKLTSEQDKYISGIFAEIKEEIDSNYHYKYEVIKNRVMDIVHYALKLEPEIIPEARIDANTRLTIIFKEALERQFPVEHPHYTITDKTPSDFAEKLSIHVNSLNRAIKKTTGKTTTQLIAERIVAEANVLLRLTDWNISEIAASLGFEEPAHFTTFYKRYTKKTPSELRHTFQ